MIRIACIGECMIELFEDAASGPGSMRRTWGGDTLNSAVYLARELSEADATVHYVTLLGDDHYSTEMLNGWTAEGIDTSLTERVAGALAGLYMIRLDPDGEREFLYWRDNAAVRRLFTTEGTSRTLEALQNFDWLYFSGITLAILSPPGRERLLELSRTVRENGGQVAFDPNFRSRLWPDPEMARTVMARAWRHASVALPTFGDEAALFGDSSPAMTVERLRAAGCSEIAVKHGPYPCIVASGKQLQEVPARQIAQIVDSTAAGDSFNAGYIGARCRGRAPVEAAEAGHELASRVIRYRGAIMPKNEKSGEDA